MALISGGILVLMWILGHDFSGHYNRLDLISVDIISGVYCNTVNSARRKVQIIPPHSVHIHIIYTPLWGVICRIFSLRHTMKKSGFFVDLGSSRQKRGDEERIWKEKPRDPSGRKDEKICCEPRAIGIRSIWVLACLPWLWLNDWLLLLCCSPNVCLLGAIW